MAGNFEQVDVAVRKGRNFSRPALATHYYPYGSITASTTTMSKYAPHGSRSSNQPRATTSTVCQKCLGRGEYSCNLFPLVLTDVQFQGHFIYECKNTRPYLSRPSRTQQLENPRLLAKLKADGKPSVEVPEEFKQLSVIPARQ
jgi:hypothetical protein